MSILSGVKTLVLWFSQECLGPAKLISDIMAPKRPVGSTSTPQHLWDSDQEDTSNYNDSTITIINQVTMIVMVTW
jgi:hypothetical protein